MRDRLGETAAQRATDCGQSKAKSDWIENE